MMMIRRWCGVVCVMMALISQGATQKNSSSALRGQMIDRKSEDWCGWYFFKNVCLDYGEDCYWDSDRRKCKSVDRIRCFDRSSKKDCLADKNCMWKQEDSFCKWKNRCSRHKNRRKCNRDEQCEWIRNDKDDDGQCKYQ